MNNSTSAHTPFPELNDVLERLADGIRLALPDMLIGFYLQGSFAIGDFDENSDVDFIAVISEEVNDAQVTALQALHKDIFGLPSAWAQHLEGSYFPLQRLQDYHQPYEKNWYLDNGSDHLEQSNHCNTLLVRWILKEKAIVLDGQNPSMFLEPIATADLRKEMLDVMHTWSNHILTHPEQYSNRFYQGFIVLSYCRMLHDYINGTPGSKKAGVEWAKMNLDPKWHGLIDRSWFTRPVPEVSVRTPADPDDFDATLKFISYVIERLPDYFTDNA